MTLADFIRKAKVSGYASGGGQEKKFDDDSLGFELIADEYRYLDRYNRLGGLLNLKKIS